MERWAYVAHGPRDTVAHEGRALERFERRGRARVPRSPDTGRTLPRSPERRSPRRGLEAGSIPGRGPQRAAVRACGGDRWQARAPGFWRGRGCGAAAFRGERARACRGSARDGRHGATWGASAGPGVGARSDRGRSKRGARVRAPGRGRSRGRRASRVAQAHRAHDERVPGCATRRTRSGARALPAGAVPTGPPTQPRAEATPRRGRRALPAQHALRFLSSERDTSGRGRADGVERSARRRARSRAAR